MASLHSVGRWTSHIGAHSNYETHRFYGTDGFLIPGKSEDHTGRCLHEPMLSIESMRSSDFTVSLSPIELEWSVRTSHSIVSTVQKDVTITAFTLLHYSVN